jgi:hypothetical protein
MTPVTAGGITMNYDQQGDGEPLILIPFLAADHACYAFQVAEYATHFTRSSLDLRSRILVAHRSHLKCGYKSPLSGDREPRWDLLRVRWVRCVV